MTRCRRCGRPLTNEDSIARGMGPVCARKEEGTSSSQDGLPPSQFADVHLDDPPLGQAVYLSRTTEGGTVSPGTNVPHLAVRHSPDGFEWGYEGSGPADLAMNIVEAFVREMPEVRSGIQRPCEEGRIDKTTDDLYNFFKREVIAPLPRGGVRLSASDVESWIRQKYEALSHTTPQD